METLDKCPICNSNKLDLYLKCKDNTVSHETFSIVQCNECEFKFTNPRPSENEIGKYYKSDEYIAHSNTNKGMINKVYQRIRKHTIAEKIQLINQLTHSCSPDKKTILDYGCGTGDFLNACKIDGWKTTGIEPSEIAKKQAQNNFDLEIFSPDSLFDIQEKSYTIVTLWHVLEHIHQLNIVLEKLQSIIYEQGSLIIALPNCNSFDATHYKANWAAFDLPRHLYHFREKDVTRLLKRGGFRNIKILPMKWDSYYVSMLSEKYVSGKNNLLKALLIGMKSNMVAAINNEKGYSSQIYIAKR